MCPQLKSVTFKGTKAPKFVPGCFDEIAEDAIAYIPDGSIGYDNTIYPFINGSPLKLF
jgi:hypothetical protein